MGELLTEHDGGGGVDGDGFRGHFPVPAACRNRDFCPPKRSFAMAAASLESFWSFVNCCRVFRREGIYRRKGGVGGARGLPPHIWARPGGHPRRLMVWGPWASSPSPLRCSGP